MRHVATVPSRKWQSRCKIEGTTGSRNATDIYSVNSSSISVTDKISGRSFSVDTGAEEYVFPASKIDRKMTRGPNLMTANGSTIATYGKRPISLKLNKTTLVTQTFWIADVTQPILGVDFFTSNRLGIDRSNKRRVSLDGGTIFKVRPTESPRPGTFKVRGHPQRIPRAFNSNL